MCATYPVPFLSFCNTPNERRVRRGFVCRAAMLAPQEERHSLIFFVPGLCLLRTRYPFDRLRDDLLRGCQRSMLPGIWVCDEVHRKISDPSNGSSATLGADCLAVDLETKS